MAIGILFREWHFPISRVRLMSYQSLSNFQKIGHDGAPWIGVFQSLLAAFGFAEIQIRKGFSYIESFTKQT
jgi:hypothetical protein